MADETRFPNIEGKSLAGSHFRLPGDFDGDPTLALIAFNRHQQDHIDTWIPLAVELQEQHAELKCYEVPVIPRGYRLVSWFIDGGMRTGIPDPAIRETTITVYTDVAKFLSALDLDDDSEVHALLVTSDGTIAWRAAGPVTAETEAGLREAVAG